ncbi:unnamed protein product, partial [Vitis vinifera]
MGSILYLFILMRFLALLSSFHLIVTNSSSSVQQPLCHDNESSALLQFKQSFLIDEYASEDSYAYPKVATWKSHGEGSDCCSWDGVECDRETGHVIGLHLASSCLYGSINSSSTLFSLVHLRRLDLSDNDFNYSEIPHGVSQLSRLRILYLAGTSYSGELPASMGKLSSLSELDISSCNFTGLVPSSLGHLTQLSYLDLSYNFFSGPIPSFLANLTTLTYLSLTSNNFSAGTLAWLGEQTKLTILYLDQINLNEGPIPMELHMLSNLKNLTDLQLSYNRISLLSYTSTNATLPKFKLLGLASCNLTEFPDFLQNQQELEVLILSTNKIHGPIPKWMWNISKETLEALNRLAGEIPSLICNLTSLSLLDLSGNNLSGSIPQCFTKLSSSLSILNLRRNNLNGPIPQTCTNTSNLRMIDLSENQLQGQIPKSLASCMMLEELVLGNNLINDIFPFWLGSLPRLQVLILRFNRFHGAIGSPKTNFEFSKLRIIDLSYNGFTEIPESIGNPNGLRWLNLSNNALIGAIPTSLANLTLLEALDLSQNKLSREIPQQLVQLTFLAFFNVSHNHLTGPIPQGKQFATFSRASFDGNPGFGLVIGVSIGYCLTSWKHEWFVKTFGKQHTKWTRKERRGHRG